MDRDDHADEEWVDEEGEDGDDLLICPSCEAAVHEDTQQCPHCGDWIVPAYPGESSKRLIWIAAALAVIAAMILITVF